MNRLPSLLLTVCVMTLQPTLASAQSQSRPGDPIGTFDIARFEVDGNTLVDAATVQGSVAEFAGKGRDFSYVERAIDKLEQVYRQRGFTLVKVILPEQELDAGVVHLRVVETRIGKVQVEGNKFHDDANIRRSLPGLQEGAIPNTRDISSSLRTANENPSKKASLQLQSAAEPGVIDATVQVADSKTWGGGLLLDNSGIESSGRNHITAQFQNLNLGGLDHVFSAQYTTSLEYPGKISVYGAGYHVPLYALGDSLDFYGSYSNVDSGSVSAGLVNLAVSGKGTVVGAHFNHNFAKNGDYDSKLVAGLDYKAFRNSVELQGVQLGNNVTVHPLSLSYIGEWAVAAGAVNFYLTGVHNVPGGPQGGDADFAAARSGASSSYSLLRYGAGYSRALPADWQLRLTLNGQATHDALIPGEQFGVGGAASVRGLQEREIANDAGIAASAELYTPNLCAALRGGVTQCRLLAFYDEGHVSRNDALPGEETSTTVGSTGAGFRLSSGKALTMQLDFGRVVSASDPQFKNEQRVHFAMALAF